MSIRWVGGDDDEVDPLAGVANLFDLGLVFALGLMIASAERLAATGSLADSESRQGVAPPETEFAELPRFRVSEESLEGSGERLGVAYRLANGEVVYVPQQPTNGDEP